MGGWCVRAAGVALRAGDAQYILAKPSDEHQLWKLVCVSYICVCMQCVCVCRVIDDAAYMCVYAIYVCMESDT